MGPREQSACVLDFHLKEMSAGYYILETWFHFPLGPECTFALITHAHTSHRVLYLDFLDQSEPTAQ